MSTNIKNIIDTWTQFDIKKIQHDLDDKVIEIAQQLEEGDKSRKTLIERTKEFRRNLNEEHRKIVAPILKQFQQEVDGSNKRSKFMEQVLLNLYKQLIDLPDPSPALENAELKHKKAEKMQDLEIECKQLKNTLEEYHEEFAHVKNQEVTIKSLKEKIKEIESSNEQQIFQRLKEKEKEIQRSYSDKEDQLHIDKLELAKKLGETENRNLEYKSQIEKFQNELYDTKQKQDEILNAKTCEMDILLQDLDKMTERAVNAERLSEQYQQSLENSAHEMTIEKSNKLNQHQIEDIKLNSLRTSSLEIELVAKEKEISQLVDDVQKLHLKSNKLRENYESQLSQLEDKLSERENLVDNLQKELVSKKDYEEIKRELNVLKTIEFNVPIEENKNGLSHDGAERNQLQQPLEILLLEKNRNLQNENTLNKNKLIETKQQLETVTKENANNSKINSELQNLVAQLEKDLLKVARKQQGSSNQTSNHQSTVLNLNDFNEDSDKNGGYPATSIVLNNEDENTEVDNEEKNSASLFNIVSNQRERFKVKCQELEADNLASNQQIILLKNELDQLRSDNVKLYEKIRFLQSASGKKTNKYKQSDIEYDADNDEAVLNKYTSAYESRLDPFSKFSYREKQRRYTNLKLHDKFTLNFSRFILSNSTSRMIFCGYFIILHLLVFFNLYHSAHTTHSNRDLSIECAHAYKNHMAEVHGKQNFSLE